MYNTQNIYTPRIFYQNIDYLTVRISPHSPTAKTLYGLVENSNSYTIPDTGLNIVWLGEYHAKGRLKTFRIISESAQIIGTIHLETFIKTESKEHVFSDVEFSGLFFVSYQEFLRPILELFEFDPTRQKCVSRIDYCFDIYTLDCNAFLSRKFKLQKKIKELDSDFLSGDDSRLIHNGDGTFSYPLKESETRKRFKLQNKKTWSALKTDRHILVVYNKKLDILDKNKHKISARGEFPFKHYLDEIPPITRLEYRHTARGLRELEDSSLNSVMAFVEQRARDAFKEKFEFDIGDLSPKDWVPYPTSTSALQKTLNTLKKKKASILEKINDDSLSLRTKKRNAIKLPELDERIQTIEREIQINHLFKNSDLFVSEQIEKKSKLSISRARAYMNSFSAIGDKEQLFNELYTSYGVDLLFHGFRLFYDKDIPLDKLRVYELESLFTSDL